MKIAFVLHQFLPFYNSGTELYAYHLARSLRARGEDVQVFCFEANFERNRPYTGISKDQFEDIPVTRLSGWRGLFPNYILAQYYNPFFGKLFREFLEEEEIELVHFFHNSYLGVALIEEAYQLGLPQVVNLMDFWYLCPNVQLLKNDGTLCAGACDYHECIQCMAPKDADYQVLMPHLQGKKAFPLPDGIYESAGTDFLAASDTYHRLAAMAIRTPLIRSVLGLTDLIIAPSEFLKSVFVESGYDDRQIRCVRYGIDAAALRTVEKSASKVLRVGYMGTIAPHKGLDVVIRAFQGMDGDGATLAVHGDMGAFPKFASEVSELAAGDDRISFHGRFEAPDLPKVLRETDVLVVPSLWYENTPFVMLESLASGTPVIASDLGGLSELVQEGANGLLFAPGDHEDLRKKIVSLLDDPGQLDRIRPDPSTARSLDDNVGDFLGIYRELTAGKTGSPSRNEETPAIDEEADMNRNPQEEGKRSELLQRQIHHLTSQIFHLIDVNSGQLRKISELERIVDDQAFLTMSQPPEAGMNIPRDLSPSIRRKLIHLEQLKAILHRRSSLIAELEVQIERQNANMERQENVMQENIRAMEERDHAIEDLKFHLEDKVTQIDSLTEQVDKLTQVVSRWWNNPFYKLLVRIKRLLGGGGKA